MANNQNSSGGEPRADVTAWLAGELDIQRDWLKQYANCGWDQVCLYKSQLSLFGDYGKYDIKRSMLQQIGGAVVLCGGATCRWVDYSAPGNIMYGYLAASRGVPQPVSWAAAGILEYSDARTHHEPYTGTLSAWGDNPGDKAAVDFGYDLYKKYPDHITLEDFKVELSQDILDSFQSAASVPNEPAVAAPGGGYTVDDFFWPTPPQ